MTSASMYLKQRLDASIEDEPIDEPVSKAGSQGDNQAEEPVEEPVEPQPNKSRLYKTKAESTKDAKARAIDNFKKGIEDPDYRVCLMRNGQYRCYKRKSPVLQPPPPNNPINLHQIPDNKPKAESKPVSVQTPRVHDPFSDIVYYNNQLTEQFNKRLDYVNQELERLRNKNHKLKGKYKQLKQAIYISSDDEEDVEQEQVEPPTNQSNQTPDNHPQQTPEPEPPQQPVHEVGSVREPILRPTRQTTAINFNRFFN